MEEKILSEEIKWNFDEIKYESNEVIRAALKEFVTKYEDKYDQFLSTIKKENSLFTLNSNVNVNVLLSTVFLSLIACDVYSSYSSNVKEKIMNKLSGLALELGVYIDDITQLTIYKSKFLNIINE
ncbi:hypothetical protein ACT7DB_02100 [Bacillus cereus]